MLYDFADATWNTRFLGDLYQDLSEDARKHYALLQTPEFVEAFITVWWSGACPMTIGASSHPTKRPSCL